MTISNALVNIIRILAKICNKENIRIVLMGGIATSFYAMPRATYDIDGMIYIEKNNFDKFFTAIHKAGFKYDKKNPVKFIHNLPFLTLFHIKNKIYIVLFIAENEFQKIVVERARKIKFQNMMVDIISPEDLILLKSQAGRERDIEDVRNIIYENFKTLDFKYLKEWAKRLKIEIFLNDEIKSLRIEIKEA